MSETDRQPGKGMHPEDLTAMTEFWMRETNNLNSLIDANFKSAQDHAYATGFRRGVGDLIEIRKQRDELLEALRICEGNISSLADSHPRVWSGWLDVVQSAIAKATGEAQ